ncbi:MULTISPECIES: MATE family efflux transporter [unclassified Sinorhizobium]|uniref:MATE family efflux transporter n=1 Tax=unclassified Sinorhizobium TaxID=2613772 RepID=UPI0024C27B44|nr:MULTISPECIES: MATE family efflux transporter [unclassified Sinorhizobium]MDK1376587.1 MATE family efflux transporter [Sinorhizobium sp. 6-70]MDK1482499.1 MATE family efflux transporter [Sinorhizobium sp. 6-117]
MKGEDERMASPAGPSSLLDGKVSRLIMRLAIPSIIGLSMNALQQFVNAIFVGTLSAQAIAAVSITLPIVLLLTSVGQGIGIGTASFVSRNLGAGNSIEASRGASLALALATPIGVALTVALLLSLRDVLALLGASPTIMPAALDYASLLLFGHTLMLLNMVNGFIVRAEGNTRYSMWTMITSFTLNALLDPILIFSLDLGVRGAALATLLSQIAATSLYAVYFVKRRGIVRVRPSYITLRGDRVKQIAAIGAPATITGILSAVSFVLLNRAAAPFGDNSIAAVGIASRLLTIGTLPIMGLCIGSQAVLGFSWGAQDFARVQKAAKFMLSIAVGFSASFSAVVVIFARPMVRLLSDSEDVAEIAVSTCIMFHLFFGLFGVQYVVITMLQSFAKARLSAVVSFARQGYLFVPAILLLPDIWGFNGLLISQAAAELVAGLLAVFVILRQFGDLKGRFPSRSTSGEG